MLYLEAGGSDPYKEVNDSFIASDDIEIGNGNKIPIWLFFGRDKDYKYD